MTISPINQEKTIEPKCLHILWLNDNSVTAENMVFMYATNALLKGWWQDVHLIVWGETTRLLCENSNILKLLNTFRDAGGRISVCRRCSENLNLVGAVEKIAGIENVYYVGSAFTDIIKGHDKLITL